MIAKLAVLFVPMAVIAGGCSVAATDNAAPTEQAAATATDIQAYDLDLYATVLSTYVNENGMVDYEGLKADRADLDTFNDSLNAVSMETYDSWSEADQIAFLINAYNSLTLKSIIDQTPLKSSIRDIPGVWRIRRHPILGTQKTLDTIEHGVLRKDFNEPRIHAALVCAAMSCPPLRTEPFTGESLDAQLDDQTTQWLESPVGLEINPEAGSVDISAIFGWFGEDWLPNYGTTEGFTGSDTQKAALNFITNYVSEEEAEYLRAGSYELGELNYDWGLNIQ